MNHRRKCSQCGTAMRWQPTRQVFEHEGAEVEVTGIPAHVCPKCGHATYPPNAADKVAAAARAMFSLLCPQGGGRARVQAIRSAHHTGRAVQHA